MIFNTYSNITSDMHAFLSPSKYHWTNYDDKKLELSYKNWAAVKRGTELHAFAAEAIRLGIKLPKSSKTLNLFVNDAIGFRMTPEQVLYYSPNCFGTADAISFRKDILRIHDLKTGVSKVSFRQLEVYAAIFCLEYKFKPEEIAMILQIYQNDSIDYLEADPESVSRIMNKIVEFDKLIDSMND